MYNEVIEFPSTINAIISDENVSTLEIQGIGIETNKCIKSHDYVSTYTEALSIRNISPYNINAIHNHFQSNLQTIPKLPLETFKTSYTYAKACLRILRDYTHDTEQTQQSLHSFMKSSEEVLEKLGSATIDLDERNIKVYNSLHRTVTFQAITIDPDKSSQLQTLQTIKNVGPGKAENIVSRSYYEEIDIFKVISSVQVQDAIIKKYTTNKKINQNMLTRVELAVKKSLFVPYLALHSAAFKQKEHDREDISKIMHNEWISLSSGLTSIFETPSS